MKTIRRFINNDYKLSRTEFFAILCGAFVFAGLFGYFYETLFYVFDKGGLSKRGTCFGPWIEIYGFGSLFIYALCHKVKKHPILVFLLSGLVCGALEYAAGWFLYNVLDHVRGWNYNTEILNFGNIDGFVCLRSVLVFAFGGLLLMYLIIPGLFYMKEHMKGKSFLILTITLAAVFMADIIYNDVIALLLHIPDASDIYFSTGFFQYVNDKKCY